MMVENKQLSARGHELSWRVIDSINDINEAQRQLIESRGGPEQVMANLVTEKNYTPVPTDIVAETTSP